MYAIVDIAGKQFKVEKDHFVYAPLMDGKEGSEVSFDQVLLVDNNGEIKIGAPTIEGASVSGVILKHVKDDKVIVFKKKRRKGYQKRNGHRQQFSQIQISGISLTGGGKKATTAKASAAPKVKKQAAPKAEVSENLISRAETKAEEKGVDVNVEQLLHHLGTARKSEKDDLKLITGIGKVAEEKLNTVGVYTFKQVSLLKAEDKKNLAHLSGITEDKINTDEWVKQAKELLKKK